MDAADQQVMHLIERGLTIQREAQLYLEEAASLLDERYTPQLIRHCMNCLRGAEFLAEDAVQTVFSKILSGKAIYREHEHSSFVVWLYAIARNECRDRAKEVKRARRRDETYGRDHASQLPFEDELAVKELLVLINKLPSQYREVSLLRREGFKWEEIAEICGISPANARKRGSRAQARLKEVVEADGRGRVD
jgi:RNA polymerase sigma-70 factor (ECF subfamily)